MKHTRTKFSWFRGIKQPKQHVSADVFLGVTMTPRVSRDAFVTDNGPVMRRGLGYREYAPQMVEAREKKPEAPRAPMADFGAATDRLERNRETYRNMTMEQRAEWVLGKTEAPYVPPFVKVEPRRAKGM